mgnify:CR=1 FL=1
MKPDIVFVGESLPDSFFGTLVRELDAVDLLIVIGSTLTVAPAAQIRDMISPSVPCILINLDPIARSREFDMASYGYCDDIVQKLCDHLNWELPKYHESP